MELSYWKSRWDQGKIGFHSNNYNPRLIRYWPNLPIGVKETVLVPLCGKTPDLIWLSNRGHTVIGVEYSDVACKQFFLENNLSCYSEKEGDFIKHTSGNITIWQGDFLKISPKKVPGFTCIYDRAALVALRPEQRKKYVNKILELSHMPARIFLHTFEYDQQEMNGPPFSVSEKEIHDLYGNFFSKELLLSEEILQKYDRFRQRGLTFLREKAYHLSRINELVEG